MTTKTKTKAKASRAARPTRGRPLTAQEVKEGKPDDRPWDQRALDSRFWNPESGGHTVLVTGEPTERVNNFGGQTVDIPTRNGVFSTGAFAILRPLAEYKQQKGRCAGAVLSFTKVGEESNTRYEGVSVK